MFDNLFKNSAPATTPASGGEFSDLFQKSSQPAIKPSFLSTLQQNAASTTPVAQTSPDLGGYGAANETDTYSGKPLAMVPMTIPKTFMSPTTTAMVEDKTRIAPTFNPTIARKTATSTFENPRMPTSASQAVRAADGATSAQQLDHTTARALGGSNMNENLNPVPTADNQKAGVLEGKLVGDVANGNTSLIDAQRADLAQKGKTIKEDSALNTPLNQWLLNTPSVLKPAAAVQSAVTGAVSKVGGFFSGLFNKAKEVGSAAVSGIENAPQTVKDAGLSYLAGEPISTADTSKAFQVHMTPEQIAAATSGKNAPIQPDSNPNKLAFATDLPKNIIQAATRSALGYGKTLLGEDQPSQSGEINASKLSPIEQLATYGKEPVGPLVDSATVAAAKQGNPKALGGLGLAGLGLGVNVTLDPGTWGEDALAKLAKETDTEKIISILTAKGVEHDGASAIAPVLARTQTPEQVKTVLQTAAQQGIIMNGAEKAGTSAADEFAAQQAGKTAAEDTTPKALNAPISDKYSIFNAQKYKYEAVPNAKAIDVVPNVDTFVHPSKDGSGFTISEGKTGHMISQGSTVQEAKDNAIKMFDEANANGVSPQEVVNKAVVRAQAGPGKLSPRYELPAGEKAPSPSSEIKPSISHNTIPPDQLEIKKGGKWQPLTSNISDNTIKENFLTKMQKEANPTPFEKGGNEKAPEVQTDEQSLAEAGAKTVAGNGTKVGGLDKETRKIYQDWANYSGQSNKAISGRMAAEPFEPLRKSGMDAVHAFQAGDRTGPLEAVDKWGKSLLAKEQEAGLPVEARSNYLPQYWANSESEIKAAQDQFINDNPGKRVSLTPGFSREATFPDYKTGEEFGLTPKYNNIPDMINARVRASEKALADRALFDNMAKHNLVVPSSKAPQGWKTLNPDKFPRFAISSGGKVFHGTVSAPGPLADLINAQLRGTESQTDRIFQATAKWATKLKTIVLGSGIPGTAIQFHAFNELAATVPELFNQPTLFTSALQYMFHPNSAEGFIDANLPMAQEAARSGLVLGGEEIALDSLAKQAVNKGLKGTVSGLFKKGEDVLYSVFAKNTFEKMIPALKIKMWADTKQFLIDQGMSEADAAKAAANRANQTFGGLNYAAMGRDPNLQNMIRTFVFAPDFWESRFKYAGNMGKGLIGKGSMAKLYRNAALTVLGAYVAMNIANKKTSGKWMFENPAGHSMDIYGGTDSAGKNIWIRPFGTDLDFARLPMDIAQSLMQTGDLSGIATDVRNRVSTLLQPALTLISNTDAYGNKVFQPANTAHPLWGQIASYAATLPVVPQVAVGLSGLFNSGESKAQALSTAAGLPVKFNSATTPTASALADMIYTERPTLESQIKKDYLAGNEQDAYNKMAEFNKNLVEMTIKAYQDNGHTVTDRSAFIQFLATHTQAQGGLKGLLVMPPTQKVLDNATKKQGQPLFNKIFPSNITTP